MTFGQENMGLVLYGAGSSFLACVLYFLGGTEGYTKVLRRFVASLIIALATNIIALALNTWHWQYVLVYPCLIFGFSLGYGVNDGNVVKKILRRTVYALGCILASLVCCWGLDFSTSACVVLGLQVIVGLTSIVLGVMNVFDNAILEQFLVCLVLTMFLPYWGFVK